MISFVVPAFNEEAVLGRTLASLAESGKTLDEPFEMVVADDASTDRTAEIAREAGARVIGVNHRQIAATRNAGAKAATGDILIFVDADTVVTPAVVAAAARAIRSGAAGGGCAFRFDRPLPLYARILETVAVPLYRLLGLASGCFIFCTAEAFRETGGFDEKLYGAEEAAMSWALRRCGRFVVLRESVTTSGRKLRAHSTFEILSLLARIAIRGPRALRRREGLDVWYGERRADPSGPGK